MKSTSSPKKRGVYFMNALGNALANRITNMNIKQLATNFDVLYRRVSDRSKVTEVMLAQLAERSEAEEKYHKALEKISGSMQNGGGDIDDLIRGVKIDLN